MSKLSSAITRIVQVVCVVLIIEMVCVLFAQVIARYVFKSAFSWSDELAIWSGIWLIMLGSALVAAKGKHVRIDFFVNLLPPKGVRIMDALDDVICAVTIGIIAYHTLPVIKMNAKALSTGMQIPQSIMYLSVVVGAVLMIFFFVLNAVNRLRGAGAEKAGEQA